MKTMNRPGGIAWARVLLASTGFVVAGLFVISPNLFGQETKTPYQQGLDAYDRGDYDQAIADYSQAIQLNPKDSLAYSARGRAYEAKCDNDMAIADEDQAIQLDPNNGLA